MTHFSDVMIIGIGFGCYKRHKYKKLPHMSCYHNCKVLLIKLVIDLLKVTTSWRLLNPLDI